MGTNYSKVVNAQIKIQSFEDHILQAYYAGLITKYATLTIYGTGAERGTYGRFANIGMFNVPFKEAKLALTHFTDLYSTALRNKGQTDKKRNFYLSQLQEITPLLKVLGLQDRFNEEWTNVENFDRLNDLAYEHSQAGHIRDWEHRTMRVDIPFEDLQLEILEAVSHNILSNPFSYEIIAQHTAKPIELMQLTFIEGLRGLTVGASDLNMLMQGDSIISQYVA
jgi:hypothetical protein